MTTTATIETTKASPHLRMAVGETPTGTQYLVINLDGEFSSRQEIAAFLRKSGEWMIKQGDLVGDAPGDFERIPFVCAD